MSTKFKLIVAMTLFPGLLAGPIKIGVAAPFTGGSAAMGVSTP